MMTKKKAAKEQPQEQPEVQAQNPAEARAADRLNAVIVRKRAKLAETQLRINEMLSVNSAELDNLEDALAVQQECLSEINFIEAYYFGKGQEEQE